ncbi:hypothetical protein JW848_06930 [Candidatus Bipolaricaulota bacterium]|nr:hypothetical protein [Candidatus Bipolaricaulota bacterium]
MIRARMRVRRRRGVQGIAASAGWLLLLLGVLSFTAIGAVPTASLFVSDGLITPNDLAGTFVVTVLFDQTMSQTPSPDVSFDPAASGTLIGGVGLWSSSGTFEDDRYTLTFTLADGEEEAIGVDISVSGARNPDLEDMAPASLLNAFDIDTAAPSVITQDVTLQLDATGNASIVAGQIDDGSFDGFGIATRVLDVTDFTCSDVGSNTVTLTVTDVNGNAAADTATVTVEDNVAPVVVTQDITVQLDATGNASITAGEIDNGSSDACGIATRVLDVTDFTCSDVGSNTVTLTVTDVNGNAAADTATVAVEDNVAPVVAPGAASQVVECDGFGNSLQLAAWLSSHGGAGATDACGYVWSDDFSGLSDGCGETGSATVVFTATDPSGNASSTSAAFTIDDTTPPEIQWDEHQQLPDSQSMDEDCSMTFPILVDVVDACCITAPGVSYTIHNPGGVTVVDNLAVRQIGSQVVRIEGSIVVSDLSGCPRTISLEIQATDCCGHTNESTDQVVLTDPLFPTIDLVLEDVDITDDYTCAATLPFTVTIADNCCLDHGSLTVIAEWVSGVVVFEPPTFTTSTTDRTCTIVDGEILAHDLASCSSTVRLTVTIKDCCGNSYEAIDLGTVYDRCPPHFTEDPPNQSTITLPTDAGVGPYNPTSNVAVFECDGNYNVSDINAWLSEAAALDSCNPPAIWWPTDVTGFVSGSNLLWSCFSGPCPGCCGATGLFGYTSTGIGTVIFEAEDACGNTITTEDPHDPSWASPSFVIVDTIPPVAVDDPQWAFSYDFAQPSFIEFVEEIDGVLRFVLRENTPIYIDVLSNDVDLCRTGMHLLETTTPSYGTAAIHASVGMLAGSCQGQIVRYAPAPDYSGPDEFEYTVRDCSGNTDTAHVDVYVFRQNEVDDIYLSAWNGIPQRFRLCTVDDMLNRVADPGRFRYEFGLIDQPTLGVVVGSFADVRVEGNTSFAELVYIAEEGAEGRDILRWVAMDPFGVRQTAVLDVRIEARTDGTGEVLAGVFRHKQTIDIILPADVSEADAGLRMERLGDLGLETTIGVLDASAVEAAVIPVVLAGKTTRFIVHAEALEVGTYRFTVSVGKGADTRFVIRIEHEEDDR